MSAESRVVTFQQQDQEGGVQTVVWDEETNHLDARYVSAPEASWRIFKFRLTDRSHTISRLPIHLPMEQSVFIAIQQYFYREIPHHYRFDKRTQT